MSPYWEVKLSRSANHSHLSCSFFTANWHLQVTIVAPVLKSKARLCTSLQMKKLQRDFGTVLQ